MKLMIITGGSRGLGLSISEEFEQKGWDIIDFSRSGKKHNVKIDLSNSGESLEIVKNRLNVIDISNIEELTVISNAAMITPIKKCYKLEKNDVTKNLTVNILTPVIVLNYIIGCFRNLEIPKTLVNLSSGAALRGMSGWSLYCASKAATENYINSLIEEELTEDNPYRVYNFDPGIMDTGMQKDIRNSSSEDFPDLERFKGFKANGDLKTPSEVAKLLIRLLDGDSFSGRYSVKELDF